MKFVDIVTEQINGFEVEDGESKRIEVSHFKKYREAELGHQLVPKSQTVETISRKTKGKIILSVSTNFFWLSQRVNIASAQLDY